jgi:peptidoglycan hydrolase-like protein with peptidoglycan-binding domain
MRVVSRTVVLRGSVASASTVEVRRPSTGGATVVTRIPHVSGSQISAGDVVTEVNGRPVFALPGSIPAYRDLGPGSSGPDVKQLQLALTQLGLLSRAQQSGHYDNATARAVGSLYAARGYDAPPPPEAASPLAIQSAEDAARAARRSLALLLAAGSAKSASERLAVAFAREDVEITRRRLAALLQQAAPRLPAEDVAFVPLLPAQVVAAPTSLGSLLSDSVVTIAAGQPVVQGRLQPQDASLVRVGQSVTIEAEVTGQVFEGVVAAVGPVRLQLTSSGGSAPPGTTDGGPSALLTIKPTERIDMGLLGQDVRLTVKAASSRSAVMAVPQSAITADADGSVFVTPVRQGTASNRVLVKVGVSGQGYVQITAPPDRLRAGDLVAVGS